MIWMCDACQQREIGDSAYCESCGASFCAKCVNRSLGFSTVRAAIGVSVASVYDLEKIDYRMHPVCRRSVPTVHSAVRGVF